MDSFGSNVVCAGCIWPFRAGEDSCVDGDESTFAMRSANAGAVPSVSSALSKLSSNLVEGACATVSIFATCSAVDTLSCEGITSPFVLLASSFSDGVVSLLKVLELPAPKSPFVGSPWDDPCVATPANSGSSTISDKPELVLEACLVLEVQ